MPPTNIRQWAGPSNSGGMASIAVDYLTIYCERVWVHYWAGVHDFCEQFLRALWAGLTEYDGPISVVVILLDLRGRQNRSHWLSVLMDRSVSVVSNVWVRNWSLDAEGDRARDWLCVVQSWLFQSAAWLRPHGWQRHEEVHYNCNGSQSSHPVWSGYVLVIVLLPKMTKWM